MVGAGLIKLRGDDCWRDLTCMYYHYETQPIPNPISRYFHFLPHWFHKLEVIWNHFVELIVPWFSFGPRTARHVAGVLLILFQVILIISGNLSFLNYLTIIPFLACFDDTLLRRVLPKSLVKRAEDLARVVHEAFYVARSGRPGPVVIDLPKDIVIGKAPYSSPTEGHPSYRPQTEPDHGQILKAIALLKQAKRPMVYAGGGVINAGPALITPPPV